MNKHKIYTYDSIKQDVFDKKHNNWPLYRCQEQIIKHMSAGFHGTVYSVKYNSCCQKVIQECWNACYEAKRVLEHDGYICDVHVNPLGARIMVKW